MNCRQCCSDSGCNTVSAPARVKAALRAAAREARVLSVLTRSNSRLSSHRQPPAQAVRRGSAWRGAAWAAAGTRSLRERATTERSRRPRNDGRARADRIDEACGPAEAAEPRAPAGWLSSAVSHQKPADRFQPGPLPGCGPGCDHFSILPRNPQAVIARKSGIIMLPSPAEEPMSGMIFDKGTSGPALCRTDVSNADDA